MKTYSYLKEIISYKEVYGVDYDLKKALELITNIPSVSMLYHLSHINICLYLGNISEANARQNTILESYFEHCNQSMVVKIKNAIAESEKRKTWPTIFWGYSNLLFIDIILNNHNNLPLRNFTIEETEKFLDAYLLINSVTNNRFTISKNEINEAAKNDELGKFLLPYFIYQRDYISNLDFGNQINRSIAFFEYLESDDVFKMYIELYYANSQVKGYRELLYNILTTFSQVGVEGTVFERRHQISFSTLKDLVNLGYIETLAINPLIAESRFDADFKSIRQHPLYKIGPTEYLIMDINFLIDQLYKAQVFAFKAFIESKGYLENFLSVKGKDFMEDIYFRKIMLRCFPKYITLDGDHATKDNGDELCDYYIRDDNKVLLIEFKDVLLNAEVKVGADQKKIYAELDKKFIRNQKNKPKGVTQLHNAIVYLENNDIRQDVLSDMETLEIYPTVVYTDQSFGNDGLNEVFNQKFSDLIKVSNLNKLVVRGVTFINLNYFEVHEEYFLTGLIDIFDFLDGYQGYVKNPGLSNTSFEVYSRAYLRENNIPDLPRNTLLTQNLQQIIPQL